MDTATSPSSPTEGFAVRVIHFPTPRKPALAKPRPKLNNKIQTPPKKPQPVKMEYNCVFCLKVFPQQAKLHRHVVEFHNSHNNGSGLFPRSPAIGPLSHQLQLNQIIYLGPSSLHCVYCQAYFSNPETLETHIAACPNKEHNAFGCSSCQKFFESQEHLKIHEDSSHAPKDPNKYPCTFCDQKFAENRHLLRHLSTHPDWESKKPLGCKLCSKRFMDAQALSRHLKTHVSLKPYVCSQCPRAFRYQYLLDQHFRSHSGERPFGCKLCGKSFMIGGSLSKHMKSHEKRGKNSSERKTTESEE